MTRSVENLSVGRAGVKRVNILCLFLSYYYLTIKDSLLKFGRYMYLYLIKDY